MNRFFKQVVYGTTLYYSIIVTVFSIIVLLANSAEKTISLDPIRILCFLPFCICFAIGNALLKYKNVEAITRWSVHFVLTVGGAFLFIILPAKLNTSSGNFMGFVFITVLYIIGVIFSAILTSRIKKSIKADKELKSKIK